MAVTVGLIAVVAAWAMGLPWGAAILLGAILAPTDPVLASEVQIRHPDDRDGLRFSLTAEGGLNDGTAFPFVMLGLGLNIVVGLAGLLDLGYVGFYAVGAYSYALLSHYFGLSFWICLPIAGMMAATFGFLLGFPVLRLRGDYLAIVTLGFGEIIRLFLRNLTDITGGPNGISNIEKPTFFGLTFERKAAEGLQTFHEYFGLQYNSINKVIFLYLVALLLALAALFVINRLLRMPIGRAWEALREDEIACRALGLNPTVIKLSAFTLGAAFAGFAGSFFAARQGLVTPESFTFIESAIILAIVVLGGVPINLSRGTKNAEQMIADVFGVEAHVSTSPHHGRLHIQFLM